MALRESFCKEVPRGQKLLDPCGPLGQEVGKNLTEEANKEIASACFGKLQWQWVH